MVLRRFCFTALAGAAVAFAPAASGQSGATRHNLSATQLFDFAARAVSANDIANAFLIYRALEHDPHIDIRSEARYRHGELLETLKRYADAAVLFRAILDEKPHAQRVRLELAKVLSLMGNANAARRELRAAYAGGLPPEVARIVNQYAAALRAYKPFGGSLEVGLAPSTNINRATTATTLASVIGPLDLSPDARAQSGLGLNVGGQVNVQLPVSGKVKLTAQIATQNSLYRASQFDDDVVEGDVGAEFLLGQRRLRVTAGPSFRLFGDHPYTVAINGTVNWLQALGKRSQIELESEFSAVNYKQNSLQTGKVYTESIAIEHAFSGRFGGKLSLFGQRTTANDPGYATSMGGASVLAWHDLGKTTIYGSFSPSHLVSDTQLFLYTNRRKEWLYRVTLGATFRQIEVAGFSPVVRLNYEQNFSTVGLYSYRRIGGDLAISRAF